MSGGGGLSDGEAADAFLSGTAVAAAVAALCTLAAAAVWSVFGGG